MARLLMEVPSIVFETPGTRSTAISLTRDLQGLITSAIDQAAAMPDGELFPPLIDSALAVIRAAQDALSRTQLLGEIGWACLRWFRRLGEFDSASDFLLKTREWWPGTAWDLPDGRLQESEEFAVFAATAEAALRRFVDQQQAGNILDAVVRVSTANRLNANGVRLAFSGAAPAMAVWPRATTFDKLIDLLQRVNRVSNTWNTAQYYSRYHLQMAESIVLAFPEVRGI